MTGMHRRLVGGLAIAAALAVLGGHVVANALLIREMFVGLGTAPAGITVGDASRCAGFAWFTEYTGGTRGRLGKANAGAVVEEFSVQASEAGGAPLGITCGPAPSRGGAYEALWFTEYDGNRIGRIQQDSPYTIDDSWLLEDPGSGPWGIAVGPDNNVWFTEEVANKIGRINPITGSKVEIAIPVGPHPNPRPQGITPGPSTSMYSRLWFAASIGNYIGELNTNLKWDKTFAYPVPTTGSTPRDITSVPGYLWFTEFEGNRIGLVDLEVEPPPDDVVPCHGDCNNDGEVTTAELITMLAIDLGTEDLEACVLGAGDDERITVDDILLAINSAADQCGTSVRAQACRDDGGTFSERDCCTAAPDFPNVCTIGACGCPPSGSAPTWVCNCGEGQCFNGEECRSTEPI